jgi:hypothetical protein
MPDRRPDLQRPSPEPRRGSEPLEQGFDRLVSAGRQLVDGVSGARPGSRGSQRGPRPGTAAGPGRPRLGELGRWVEDKLDWILEDEDGDDWREPWQEPRPARLTRSRPDPTSRPAADRPAPPRLASQAPASPAPGPAASGRRPLEAISRRGERRRPAGDDWPDDTSFSRPRWQRPLRDPSRAPDLSAGAAREAAREAAERRQERSRPLPRSSRRRPG